MSSEPLNLDHLPLQKALVESVFRAFADEDDVLAAIVVGSLAAGRGDRISDADIVIFSQNQFHRIAGHCFSAFEADKSIFYSFDDSPTPHVYSKKYIFYDLTSAEIHCLDVTEPFALSQPYALLFDKTGLVAQRLTEQRAPRHEDFPAYPCGDKGLIWELFDCIKWLSRGNMSLAKAYLNKLSDQLQQQS